MSQPSAFVLRALQREDLPVVMAVAANSFPKVWAEKDFDNFLQHTARYAQGAFHAVSGTLVGYLIGLVVAGDLDIISIATDPHSRRQGIAEALLKEAQAALFINKITLEVDVENIPAYALYRKLSFAVVNVRKQYYEKTRDAYLMTWERLPKPG